MDILATGASGFLGGHVVEALVEDGHSVTVLARETSDLSAVRHLDLDIHYGDLTDVESIEKAAEGKEAMVHCAGAVKHVAPYSFLHDVNVKGTKNMVIAASRTGVQRIVHASSLGVRGLGSGGNPDNYRDIKDKYCRSKAEAEVVLFSECEARGIEAVALRPGVIYGPRDFTASYHWFRMVDNGETYLIGDGTNPFPLIYIEDLKEVFVRTLKRDEVSGQAFDLDGEDRASLKRVLELIADELNKDIDPRQINYYLALLMAYISEFRTRLSGYEKNATISKFVVRLFGRGRNYEIDCSKAEEMLDFDGGTPLEEGIKTTAEWYRSIRKD